MDTLYIVFFACDNIKKLQSNTSFLHFRGILCFIVSNSLSHAFSFAYVLVNQYENNKQLNKMITKTAF